MDSSNWRPAQPEPAMEGAAGGGDWRSQLPPDSRQRIVNKIMETLKLHLPCSGQDGLQQLKKIAVRFEEKIYSAATSQSDYLRKISLKMLTMESKPQNPMSNTLPANSSGMSRNPQDSAPQSMQSQVQNQGQSLGMPMAPIQSQVQGRQQLLAHNVQNNISSAGMQNSSSLSSTLPPVSGLTQNPMPNVAQNSNIHNIGQGSASSAYTNDQRQMQGRQQVPQGGTQQQQYQNQQQYMYQQQIQQHMMKQNLHPGNMQQPLLQPHIQQPQQQQNLLPSAQLQSCQQSVMPTSTVMQPPMVPGLPPNQQASIQQQPQSVYQQHQQSLSRQQQQPQQASVHQLLNQMSQLSMLQMQQQQPSPQQQMMGQQANVANVQPSQLMGQQNSLPDMQQQRLLGQLANLPSQQHNNHQNLQPQQLVGQQNNLSNMQQQQLGHQSQQLPGAQSGNPGMPTSQHPTAIMQQSKVAGNQKTQSSSGLVPGGGQQPQQQLMIQIQSQLTQLQQPLGLQQQQSNLQHNMQQRLQASNSLLRQQNMIDQQKQMFQSQRGLSEAPSTSLDSTAQTSGAVDCQEEVYQKIKTMKDMYFADLNEFYQEVSMKLQQVDSHPQQPKMENIEKLRIFKQSMERMMHFLLLTKNNNLSTYKDRLPLIEKQIVSFLSSNRPRRPVSSLQQGQLPPPHQSMQHMQRPHTQTSQAQSHETGFNSLVQSLSSQGPGALQQGNASSLQQGSVSVITSLQQNMNSSLQPPGSLDSGQGNAAASKQQAAMGSLQQNPVGASLQNQHKQHEQHVMQTQQLKQQMQQRQIQQLRQLQQLKQQHLQQTGQMQSYPNTQLHQMNDANDIKLKSGISLKQGVFQQHLSQGQGRVLDAEGNGEGGWELQGVGWWCSGVAGAVVDGDGSGRVALDEEYAKGRRCCGGSKGQKKEGGRGCLIAEGWCRWLAQGIVWLGKGCRKGTEGE